jgi:1,4-alpha-glucan branching enzyme
MGGTVVAASAVEGRVMVVFRLDAPGVQGVRLAGDFTDWVPGPALTEVSPGVWSTAVPVDLGIHDYAFVVDGTRWVPDPLAEQVDDGFGGSNSRVAVLLSGQEDEV